jgi:hypothetical protein
LSKAFLAIASPTKSDASDLVVLDTSISLSLDDAEAIVTPLISSIN